MVTNNHLQIKRCLETFSNKEMSGYIFSFYIRMLTNNDKSTDHLHIRRCLDRSQPIKSGSCPLCILKTTSGQTNEMEDSQIASNRQELGELLAEACDRRGIQRHRNQPPRDDAETCLMEIGMST